MTASASFLHMRGRVLEAIAANPAVGPSSPEMRARMLDPAGDCSLEELGFDSLALMEFCIFFETEYGIAVTSGEIEGRPSINALARWLADTAA